MDVLASTGFVISISRGVCQLLFYFTEPEENIYGFRRQAVRPELWVGGHARLVGSPASRLSSSVTIRFNFLMEQSLVNLPRIFSLSSEINNC